MSLAISAVHRLCCMVALVIWKLTRSCGIANSSVHTEESMPRIYPGKIHLRSRRLRRGERGSITCPRTSHDALLTRMPLTSKARSTAGPKPWVGLSDVGQYPQRRPVGGGWRMVDGGWCPKPRPPTWFKVLFPTHDNGEMCPSDQIRSAHPCSSLAFANTLDNFPVKYGVWSTSIRILVS
jgi:hypothetical protein